MIRNCLLIILLFLVFSALGQDTLYTVLPGQSNIEVRVKEVFVIKLRSCHSCGSHWNLEQADTLGVKVITVTSENAEGKPNRIGGDVFEFWKLTGIKPGEYELVFVQRGPARLHEENGRCTFNLRVH